MKPTLTRQDLQELLKTGVFIKDGTGESYQFTETMLTINDKPVCPYEVIQEDNAFYLKLNAQNTARQPLRIDIVESSPAVIKFTERKREDIN